jgi:hypothetical protein
MGDDDEPMSRSRGSFEIMGDTADEDEDEDDDDNGDDMVEMLDSGDGGGVGDIDEDGGDSVEDCVCDLDLRDLLFVLTGEDDDGCCRM